MTTPFLNEVIKNSFAQKYALAQFLGLSWVPFLIICSIKHWSQVTLVQIPNSHSLGLKTVNSSVTEVEKGRNRGHLFE